MTRSSSLLLTAAIVGFSIPTFAAKQWRHFAIGERHFLALAQGVVMEGVVVTVSKSQILVGDEKIMSLPSRQSLAQSGVGAQYKRSGPNDLYIVPLGNALQSARKTDKLVRQAKGMDASMSEAIVIADNTTPYRLFIEVLFTLGQNEFGKYHLMVMQKKKAAPS